MPTFTRLFLHDTVKRLAPAVVLFAMIGCGLDFPFDLEHPPDNETPVAAGNERPSQVVTVRFNNFAVNEAVDVEFYMTTDELTTIPEQLFTEQNRFTASIGVAGTGIMEPLFRDVIELPCSPTLTLGTSGGRFLDNETGELRGQGQPRWVQESALGLCGGTVTIEYAIEAEQFITRVQIGN